jgi:hypothetical protein
MTAADALSILPEWLHGGTVAAYIMTIIVLTLAFVRAVERLLLRQTGKPKRKEPWPGYTPGAPVVTALGPDGWFILWHGTDWNVETWNGGRQLVIRGLVGHPSTEPLGNRVRVHLPSGQIWQGIIDQIELHEKPGQRQQVAIVALGQWEPDA